MGKPKVSIIVPVYNVSQYLEACISSIINQTLIDIEIICIDDGSTDNSGPILDAFACTDSRVKVLHRENGGYGKAMNAGLAAATGEYIGIVESDDCILPEMFETLCRAADENGVDFVKSDAYYWLEQCDYKKRVHIKAMDEYYNKVLGPADRNLFFDFFMNIWTGVYRKSFLDIYDIRFHESPGASYQDNGFWMQTMMYAQKAMWLDEAFYLYRNDNPTASVRSPGKIYAMTKEYEYLEKLLLERKNYALLPYCYYMRLFRDKGTFLRIADECKIDFSKQIREDLEKYQACLRGNHDLLKILWNYAENADAVCDRMIQTKNKVYRSLEHARSIIIYGAGFRGDMVFRTLYNEGFYDKIACFAVSECKEEQVIAGKQVLPIKEAVEIYKDSLIILAVVRNTNAYKSMLDTIQGLKCTEYIDGTDIEENFYIL